MMIWFLRRNWLVLTVGITLTGLAVRFAYLERGYIACGGEWMTLTAIWVLRNLAEEIFAGNRR